ncbi:MAG: adenosylcobinamide-GDP ribazoletransferase [Deltaproteobacteria bacterium]|jgi:adenosylcobinamide-GDP ribazoletransferase|nr:adenosylcobinamide-GDP ribazoletransferase [Deltaproteobacteria bacterium]MBW2482014.1 adenosylcobinamide-GDP ribazoletransferase [Deltaproteobacteria bacterium]
MRYLISAIQFITILPAGKPGPFDPPKMMPFFPLVGLLLGVLVAVVDRLAAIFWNEPVVALLDVIFLAMVTGAFHLDGLGDTADGLLGQRPRDKALIIMKDSRIGAMGLVAVVFGLALKWGGIAGLEVNRSLLLILIPAYARSGVLFGIRFLEYGRPDGGTGLEFFKEPLKPAAFWGLILPVGASLLLGGQALWLNLGFILIVSTILFYYKKRIGCITGDMCGAMIELLEAGLFLLVSVSGI